MGEPSQTLADAQIDANDRLRRMYYNDAPDPYKLVYEIELGFLEGMKKNLRMRALFSPSSNLSVPYVQCSSSRGSFHSAT
jgi:hypothetical protein